MKGFKCFVEKEYLEDEDLPGGYEVNLILERVSYPDGRTINLRDYFIISFDPRSNPKEQENIVILSDKGTTIISPSYSMEELINYLKEVIERNPEILDSNVKKYFSTKCNRFRASGITVSPSTL